MTSRWCYASILLVAGTLALHACAAMIPNVPTTPLSGQTAATAAKDEQDCAQATAGIDDRSSAYAACMIANGYEAAVWVMGGIKSGFLRSHVEHMMTMSVSVKAHGPKDAGAVLAALYRCKTAARESLSVAVMIFGPLIGAGVVISPAERGYQACAEREGLAAHRWQPARSPFQ